MRIIRATGQGKTIKSIIKLCLILTAAAVLASAPATAQEAAPHWVLPCIYGTNINSTNFAGQVVVVDFWATWCPYCVAEIPDLISLQQKYGPDGLTVVGISLDDSTDGINPPTAMVRNYATNEGMNYPVVMDCPGYAVDYLFGAVEYGPGGYIEYIPNTFIIDRQNHIAQTFVGEVDYGTIESALLPLLYSNLKVSVSFARGKAHISWPVTQATFAVQSTGDLAGGVWTLESATVQSTATNQFIEVPVGASPQFFRLQSQ